MAEHTPYAPPRAALAEPPGPPARGIRVGAVVLGVVVDVGGSLLAGLSMFFWLAWRLSAQGVPEIELQDAVSAAALEAPFYQLVLLAGLACTVAGGWCAGLLARHAPLLHAGIVGGVTLGLAALFKLLPGAQPSGLLEGVSYLLTIPAAVLGGRMVTTPARAGR